MKHHWGLLGSKKIKQEKKQQYDKAFFWCSSAAEKHQFSENQEAKNNSCIEKKDVKTRNIFLCWFLKKINLMFIISHLNSPIIYFTHWKRDKNLRDSGFGQVSWKPITKHGGKIQGKVLLKKRLNPELSLIYSLATWQHRCRCNLANPALAVWHQPGISCPFAASGFHQGEIPGV